MRPESRVHVGTSGWNYDSWKGGFYPADISSSAMLEEYTERFSTVELNNSFYHLPEKSSIKQWCDNTPEDFTFACKASRYITHMKKLNDPKEGISNLLDALSPFGDKLGPILFQLPPNWKVNPERLETFLKNLSGDYRYTFEFRDKSWLCEEVYSLLKAHNVALCFYDYENFRSPEEITADFIYLRLHGPKEAAYKGSYDGRRLAGYAKKCLNWAEHVNNIYCYFDNDEKSCAPADAKALLESIEKQA